MIFSIGGSKNDFYNLASAGPMWGPIDLIGTIHIGKGWAYGPIPSPRIRSYPRTISKGRSESCIIGRGKEYLWRI